MLWCLLAAFLAAQWVSPAQQEILHHNGERTDLIKRVETDKRWIALTFDDGPDPVETVKILDLLSRYKAKATFFIIGKQAEKHPEIINREVLEGHELANHTYSHRSMSRLSNHDLEIEIKKAENVIFSATNQHPRLFRPPGGYYTNRIVKKVNELGYTVVMWTWYQDSRDWSKPGVNKIVDTVLSHAHPGDIVLFHDRISGKSQTCEALEIILQKLQKDGYQFVTVSDLIHAPLLSNE
jgi:polysaccharide deacetylase family sporulation protein PdaB